ncbi:hypothetical protein EZ449_02160 [Pedobacter frigidisoli]|uniref:DUF4197 domain-containing protein n=1 Tax=Pedobacter frigidisoli TaxID=2530455 RepID=A0A4R0P797_9SPHI|nr:hypothetical protein [Pedobacter frigidisoli]TCD12870.1 hypothetical protein EZ449_02160 [Pedobacter frigidisoli]
MKKLLILSALILGLNFASNAQSFLSKVGSAAASSGLDIGSLTNGILGKLTPALSLTPAQKPTVTSIVKDFLVQKATALATKQNDPTGSKTKVASLISGLKSKLGTALTIAQMAKFTSLKPATPSATNVLSQLFY